MVNANYKLAMFVLALSICGCKTIWINTSAMNDLSGASNVVQLQISPTDVTGWQQVAGSDGFNVYSAQGLYKPLDGGADPFNQKGVIEGIIQKLDGPTPTKLEAIVLDFGSEPKAITMFQFRVQTINPPQLIIPNFSDSMAFASSTLDGVTVYAYIKKFYFEVALSGFQDQSEALQTASLFVDLYSSKIE